MCRTFFVLFAVFAVSLQEAAERKDADVTDALCSRPLSDETMKVAALTAFASESEGKALLKTTIFAIPKNNPHSTREKVQPGTLMQLQAIVENTGTVPSDAGDIQMRFAFPEPLHSRHRTATFETEKMKLPSIAPGRQVTLVFKKKHQWPSLFDYIREDWAMKEYQAVVTIGSIAKITGTRTVAFSAYYYEGASWDKPVSISSKN